MRPAFAPLLLAFASLVSFTPHSPAADPAKDAPRLRLLVPAYFYPAGDGAKDWDRLFIASARVPIVAIVNPASGPGKKADPNYTKLFARAEKADKTTLIGYVATTYGKRPLDEVEADVDRWIALYPGVRGIFFDEQASGVDRVAYQAALYEYVRVKRRLKRVVTNPGTVCDEKYLSTPATDAACLFESPKPIDAVAFPKWVAKVAPDRVAVLSYKIATAKEMEAGIRQAVAKKVGTVYVTDAEGANPWGRLPSYWAAEVELVRRINGAK